MRKPNIAILGATGVVGREITSIVTELGVDFNTIKFLSSAKSAGTKIDFQGKEYTVEEATPDSFNDVDIVIIKKEHDISLANKIMKTISGEFEDKVSVSIKFA